MSRASVDEAVVTTARGNAKTAASLGHLIYAPVLVMSPGITVSTTVNRWGMVIAAVEAEGWQLVEWAAAGGNAYPVFRRAVTS